MATRKARRKAEGRNIIVNVKIGDTKAKPKRRRRARKASGMGGATGISPIGRTGVEYLPPYVTPSPSAVLPETDPFRRMAATKLLEDVKQAEVRLLKDIERQTEGQINRRIAIAQGAEQRGALAQLGAFDPQKASEYARPFGDVATSQQPPSLSEMTGQKPPIIEEIKRPRGRPMGAKDKPKIVPDPDVEGQFIEVASRRKPRLKVVESNIPVVDLDKKENVSEFTKERYNLLV